MININTNLQSIKLRHQLNDADNLLRNSLNKISTGYKINSSSDDAAGYAISTKMDYELSTLSVAQNNTQMGQALVNTASGGIDLLTGMLQRLRDLAEQAANGTYSKENREAMQAEADALTDEIYRTKNTIEFNGINLLGNEKTSIISEEQAREQNYTIVKTAQELKSALKSNDKNCKVILFADIDLNDLEMTLEGNWTAVSNFKGTFDGNGFTISNLKIDKETSDYQGLFGSTNGAEIRNVTLEGVNVSGKDRTGGLVGANSTNSIITNCSSSGTVTGNGDCTGGLVGWNYTNSTITNCSSSGTVIGGASSVGGLVGSNHTNSTITNCTSSGTVTGNGERTGGLVGNNYINSTITNCSTTGTVTGNSYTGGLAGLNYLSSIIINCSASGTVIGNGHYTGGLVGVNANEYLGDYTTKSIIENCWCSAVVSGTGTVFGGFVGVNRESDILGCSYDKSVSGQPKDVGSEAGEHSVIEEIKDRSANPITKSRLSDSPINLQVGVTSGADSVISFDTKIDTGYFKLNLTSEKRARESLNKVDTLMNKLVSRTSELGAISNRLESVTEQISVQISALTSSVSSIRDADIAVESSNYIRSQILRDVTATLLTTANQSPSLAITLLNGLKNA